MRIVTLVENVAYGKGLSGEHGLSLYIEHDGHRIIFDTGQGERFLENAKTLGIDITKVEALIVSHGHYDHAGGLEAFCRANADAVVFTKKGFFEPKYNKDKRFIGIPYNGSLFEGRIRTLGHSQEIFPGVHIMTEIPLIHAWDTHFDNLFVKKYEDLELDQFLDEQFLVVVEEGALVVISGCSHRGITNILSAARKAFSGETAEELARKQANPSTQRSASSAVLVHGPVFKLVLGGFHLHSADNTTAERIIHALEEFSIERLGCCHCTGIEHYAQIKAVFGQRAFYAWTGTELML